MIDARCVRCNNRLSIADPGDLCMFCVSAPPPAPVVPVELTRKWLGINADGQRLCRCGAVVVYRSMCAPCSARDVRERRKRKEQAR